jgi:pentatricopeptide repeat protein
VRVNGGGVSLTDWTDEASVARRVADHDVNNHVLHLQRVAWESAIGAFISVCEIEKATELFQSMLDSVGRDEIDLLAPPPADAETMGRFLVHLAKSGQLDLAEEWHDRLATSSELNRTKFQRFLASDLHALSDELVYAGRWRKAVSILGPRFWAKAPGGVPLSIDKDVARRVYIAIVAFATSASDAEALEVVPLLRQIADYCKIIIDPILLVKHVALCERLGRYDEIPRVLDGFMPFSTPSTLPGLHTLAARVIPQMTLSDVGQLLRAFTRQRQQISSAMAAAAAQVYVDARAKVSTGKDLELSPDGWFRLTECFARIRGPQLEEGEWDEAMERYLSDVAELRSDKGDYLAGFDTPSSTFNGLVKNVLDRFGSDRTRIMLKPFGDQNVEEAITRVFAEERESAELQSPVSSELAADSASTSAIDMTSQSDIFSIPPTSASESSMTPPYSPQPPSQHTLHVDLGLSVNVDKHTARNPPLTPLQAYHQVRKALTMSNAVPHIDALSRLISSLGRIGEEAKVQELYNLCQVVLSSAVPQSQQAAAWRNVEDAMLNASCFLGHLEQAGAHRARIVQAGMSPSADAYATMIASSKDTTDDALVARELFDESQALGVRPNLYLYNTIISKLSKARKAEVALELFGHMKEAGIRPSSVTYGAVIVSNKRDSFCICVKWFCDAYLCQNACCRVGDSESAETLFAEMASQPNFKPRVPPFK